MNTNQITIKMKPEGWIEWARNVSPKERQGAIDSEKFRNLSEKTQEIIVEGIDELKNVEQKESSRKVDKDKVEESDDAWEEGVKKQLFYQFDRALEQRRQFIRQRDLDITEEILGMPKWNAKPADPVIIPAFDDLKPKEIQFGALLLREILIQSKNI